MDFNIVVLSGKLAAAPEVRAFERGSRLIRYLVTTRSETPRRRVDVVPVVLWDPDESHLTEDAPAGRSVWVAGSVQRRFWAGEDGRRSRLEVIAHHVEVKEPDPQAEPA
jgi:single-stranded DNA-binding protein